MSSSKVAPWLQGLSDEGWEAPLQTNNISSASHDANSLRSSRSKIPRRSLSGLPSSLSRQTSSTAQSSQKRRHPLGTISSNANALQRRNSTSRSSVMRSVSQASNGSSLPCGTVQQRSKSASPSKMQETMEWKRRLVHGQTGYGDQTDLFGPSGLENIFSRNMDAENTAPKHKRGMSWLQKSDAPMPSSPPPWPSSFVAQLKSGVQDQDSGLDEVPEEDGGQQHDHDHDRGEESFVSNPFDLESANGQDRPSSRAPSNAHLGPRQAPLEPSRDTAIGNRTISGQTELEQEDFSPVFISKHHTVNGQINYAAVDSHTIKQFQSMKVDLRHPSQRMSSANKAEEPDQSTFTDGPDSQEQPEMPDISFSENLSTGSPLLGLGNHVELKRGGYSQYGSFKTRPLSPSQSTTAASQNLAASARLSASPREGQTPAPAPTPPRTPGVQAPPQEPQSRSSGSPLKLFGAHDTFTNNRLLRRMSQLNPDGTLRQPAATEAHPIEVKQRVVSFESFGKGELDHHEFNTEITITSASDEDKDNSEGSPGSDIPVPGSKTPMAFRFDSSPQVTEAYKLKRKLSKHSTATSRESRGSVVTALPATMEDAEESLLHVRPAENYSRSYAEGKRPSTSPFKSPTPKRRRTLHASELEDYMTRVNDTYHSQLQEAVSTRKRKDARYGEAQVIAGPDVLASRKILRPRNPTPSQQRRQQIEAELKEAAEEFAEQEPEKLEAVLEQIESSMVSDSPKTMRQHAEAVASEVAAFTLNVQKPSGEHGQRKRSVTTQDFLDEAMMVMNLIRAKARPQSNLGSVEESDGKAMDMSLRADDSRLGDSLLRVSRPPSREHSGWRQRTSGATNARVASQLRRFQETDDHNDTDFIATEISSLRVDDEDSQDDHVLIEDERSNIRISGPRPQPQKHGFNDDSRPNSQRTQDTVDSQKSNGHTVSTSSTRKSENVGTLAPDAVAHLIGDQVGGMTFDKEQQRWVRVTRSPAKSPGSFLELPSNVTSDDDPFREISDLPVDEQTELRRVSSPGKAAGATTQQASVDERTAKSLPELPVPESRTASQETVVSRPVTRDNGPLRHNHSSSVPSRYTAFASSQQQCDIETRATSWSTEELAKLSAMGKNKLPPLTYAAAQAGLARLSTNDEEDQAGEQRTDAARSESLDTVQEATESVEVVDDSVVDSVGLRDNTVLDDLEDNIEDIESPKLRQAHFGPALPPSTIRSNRQLSLRQRTLRTRLRDVHEHSEMSFVAPLPGDRMMSLSLSVSRPLHRKLQPYQIAELQSSPSKVNSSYILSDLPDFTMHEEDVERPSERALAHRLAQHAAVEVNDRFALAVKELVKTLTDVNEDEPYWEDLRELDLHNRSLGSLHRLEDFCPGVQELDVSKNALTQLHGAPSSVRKLDAGSNHLSGLTGWGHLFNLQYLDISSNHLENLDGLCGLVHMRELKADDNQASRLDGVFELDGLLKLRLRRNKLKTVDLSSSKLQRLTSLDLSSNQISSITGLETLTALEELHLDSNNLSRGLQVAKPMPRLKTLSLRHCNLEHLDVTPFAGLQQLIVDGNRLTNIGGLGKLRQLQLLSMRAQDLPEDAHVSIFKNTFDADTVRLSGNNIPTLQMGASILTLRHLELASAGLNELPADFGLRMPNLRKLNLNFNNLKDVRPLLNIQRLEELSVCGNRLHRLRQSVATFSKLTSLTKLNLRDNPLTQNFYPSLASTMSRNTALVHAKNVEVEDEDDQAEAMERAQYEYPAAADVETDRQHAARLDEDTKLRRRVHQLLLVSGCAKLDELDGLKVDRSAAFGRDDIMERLMELGVVKSSNRLADSMAGALEPAKVMS